MIRFTVCKAASLLMLQNKTNIFKIFALYTSVVGCRTIIKETRQPIYIEATYNTFKIINNSRLLLATSNDYKIIVLALKSTSVCFYWLEYFNGSIESCGIYGLT